MKKELCARKECPQKVRGWKGEKCGEKYGFPQELRPEKSCAKELLGIFLGILYRLPLLMCEHGVQFMVAVSMCIIPKVTS